MDLIQSAPPNSAGSGVTVMAEWPGVATSAERSRPVNGSAGFEALAAVADAVLYEGYLLYPYRRSSPKNKVRWQFGVLAPRSWLTAELEGDTCVAGSADGWYQQTECLLEAPETATINVRLRFLHVQHRCVQQAHPGGGFEAVDALTIGDERFLTFDDAVPREHDVVATVAELRAAPLVVDVHIPAGEDIEPLPAGSGRIVRSHRHVSARVRLSVTEAEAPFPLAKLSVRAENCDLGVAPATPRPEALRASMIATHTMLGVDRGAFLSLLDPPEWATPAAKGCRNIHSFPVLGGEPGERRLMLSSPILLYDHPAVSPESPGDLFDAAEIDEILSLRTGTLTDDEKREARATDPRAAAIIDRVDAMPREVMDRLHGAIRSMRPHREPEPHAVTVGGARIAKGSRVRLRPRPHGTDAHDMFLAGRLAVVEDVLIDMDDEYQIAVTLVDDPGADLHQWHRRFYYFSPHEVAPADRP